MSPDSSESIKRCLGSSFPTLPTRRFRVRPEDVRVPSARCLSVSLLLPHTIAGCEGGLSAGQDESLRGSRCQLQAPGHPSHLPYKHPGDRLRGEWRTSHAHPCAIVYGEAGLEPLAASTECCTGVLIMALWGLYSRVSNV